MKTENIYDVIVVGAGPAGGHCARILSGAGCKVLLAERNKDFSVNNYSSGGAPLDILTTFDLPADVVGNYWNKLHIYSNDNQAKWESVENKGIVLDFMKLRVFLAKAMEKSGGTLKLGLSYLKHDFQGDLARVWFKDVISKETHQLQTKVLVDATGCERQILGKGSADPSASFSATGIEYLVETTPENYKKFTCTLSFFMGSKWMPQGYAWIFPMEPNRLKLGVGRYFQNDNYMPYQKSYHYYLDNLIRETLGTSSPSILDKHGKTIVYTYGQKDPHYDRNVIVIGDAVSSINPLGLEGIRHAMQSSQIAAKHIMDRLRGQNSSFESYVKELHKYYGMRWRLSEWLMRIIYRQADNKKIDLMADAFQTLSMDEIMALAFYYEPAKALKFAANYTYLSSVYSIKKLIKI